MCDPMETTISEAEVREELRLLLQSKSFQQSQRLVRFLNFTVERAIADKLEELKEYTIGVEVYDRGPSFCPSLDSIVRGEARRLRGKLKEYYEGEGRRRPITIYYRLGSYVPLFRRTEPLSDEPLETNPHRLFPTNSPYPVIAVAPFRDLSNNSTTLALANGITDDLIHLLTTAGIYRVVAPGTFTQLVSKGVDTNGISARLGVQILFEGSVKQEDADLRITASLVDADGFQLSSHRFEISTADNTRFLNLQESVASDLVLELSRLVQMRSRGTERCPRLPGMAETKDHSSSKTEALSSCLSKPPGADHFASGLALD